MANIINQYGQVKLGVRYTSAPLTSTLWNSIYSVYNADAVGSSSLKTSLFAAYNGESNANDSFGSNNGTAVGGLTYTTGKIGDAFNFNGTTSYVELPNSSNQFNFTGDFSVSTWINTPNYTSNRMIFVNYVPGGTYGYGIFIYHTSTNVFSFELRNGNTIGQYQTSAGIPTNSWNHITFVRKVGQAAKIYLNGVLISGAYSLGNSSIAPSFPGTQIVNIGSNTLGGSLANYKQDATTIWQKELTQSEITELYNSGNGAQYITDSFYKPTTNDALNTYNGTAQGGLTYGVGKVGTAFQFNGTNAYVQLPNNSFNFTGDFSVSGWINQSSIKPYHMIIGNQAGVSGNFYGWLLWVFNNKLTLDLYNGNAGAASARWQPTTTLSTNTWIHFAITKKPGQAVKMYLNGVSVPISIIFGSNSGTVTYLTTNYSSIGANKYSSPIVVADAGYWNGSMDALNVWNKELSATEITELYNSGNGKQYPN
jgi:hypothetical protein